MLENLIVAFSNIPCLWSISQAFRNNDLLTAGIIANVGLASFLSHLVENHKHGMPGIGFSNKISYYLNRMDVAGCIFVISRLLYLYYHKYGCNLNPIVDDLQLCTLLLVSLHLLRISEFDKYNPELKYIYIATHSFWHISIFTTMNLFLSRFIY